MKEKKYKDKVVLITSTYNGAGYLREMLESILAQTYRNITLYVRDDGSTDESVEILREYREKFAEATGQMELLLQNELDDDWANKGSHQSYRYLLAHMPEAPYYLFCDQDDVWLPTKTQRAVTGMRKYPEETPILYVHNYYVCDQELNIQHQLPYRPSVIPEQMEKTSLSLVIMTGTWGGVGMSQGFNKKLKELAFDAGEITDSVAVDCWISWVVAGMNGALLYDREPQAYYRRHQGTFSSGDANGLARYRDWLRHMDRHCANIVNGIRDYKRLYAGEVSPERRHFLELFAGRNRIGKFLYPRRLRKSLVDELAFRMLILAGRI